MYRIGFAVLTCLLMACNGKESKNEVNKESEDGNTPAGFNGRFRAASLPYQLTDTTLQNNEDTASLPAQYITSLVPDSVIKKIFGKSTRIKYIPLAKVEEKNKETYYIMKAVAGSKKAALLLAFDKSGSYGAAMPFLVPDENNATSQVSLIDNSHAITKTVIQKSETDIASEGKEVLAFDAKEKRFTLIMTDLLSDNPDVLVNPIDTFPKKNKLAGDYYMNKKNIVSVRDGRHANQLLVYIHTENSDGDCMGQLKGEFLITSSTTAVYRQGGDPCVLGLTFLENSVSIKEESGCGNYRGLDCPFDAKFTRKKEEKAKETTKKERRTKQT